MRKFAMPFLAITMTMLLALSACGAFGDGNGEEDAPPEATPTQEVTPAPEPGPSPETPQEIVVHTPSELIGTTWAWDAANAYLYNFHEGGEGTRGAYPGIEEFAWSTEGNVLLINTEAAEESWAYIIDGDVLTISNTQIPGIEFSYLRVAADGTVAIMQAPVLEGGPVRGIWTDGVYASDYLGITFTLPEGWHAHSDVEIAAAMGIALNMVGNPGSYIPANVPVFNDMTASNPLTGANVQIILEAMNEPITAEDYLEMTVEGVALFGGTTYLDHPSPVRMGNYDWHVIGTEMDFGIVVRSRQFVNIHDGFIRNIVVSYLEGSEEPDDILNYFGDL